MINNLVIFLALVVTFCGLAFGRTFSTTLDTKNRTSIMHKIVNRSTSPRLTQNRCYAFVPLMFYYFTDVSVGVSFLAYNKVNTILQGTYVHNVVISNF